MCSFQKKKIFISFFKLNFRVYFVFCFNLTREGSSIILIFLFHFFNFHELLKFKKKFNLTRTHQIYELENEQS